MAYSNYFPMAYQPSYYPQSGNFQNGNTQNNGIIWVQGEAGAKSYLVAPNNTVQLWDSEAQTIYLKSADASGMPSMKILDYTIRGNAPVTAQNAHTEAKTDEGYIYATKEDIEALSGEIADMKRRVDELSKSRAKATKEGSSRE